jgi:hypothetical protein
MDVTTANKLVALLSMMGREFSARKVKGEWFAHYVENGWDRYVEIDGDYLVWLDSELYEIGRVNRRGE